MSVNQRANLNWAITIFNFTPIEVFLSLQMIDFNLVMMVWASVSRLCEVVILGSLTRLKSFVCQFKILSILTQRENIRFQTSSSQHNFYYPHKYFILFPKLHSHSLTNILNFLILISSLPVVKVWDGSKNVNKISTLL